MCARSESTPMTDRICIILLGVFYAVLMGCLIWALQ